MSMFDVESGPIRSDREPIPMSDIDMALTSQLVVAWAGETGEEHRLGWWRSDLVSEYGGEDLFRRLLPSTWRWAVLQGAREAARRVDAELRRRDHDPDRIVSLFSLGFELDERIEERLAESEALGPHAGRGAAGPGGHRATAGTRIEFWDWVTGHGEADADGLPGRAATQREPAGCRGSTGTQARRGASASGRELPASPLQEGVVTGPARDDRRAHAAVTVRPRGGGLARLLGPRRRRPRA